MWTMQWADEEPHPVECLDELRRMLDELAAIHTETNPILVQIAAPEGEVLMAGIGGDLGVLDHIAAGGWPAEHSVGDPDARGTIEYMMGTHHSPMPRSCGVQPTIVRRAIEHFYLTGKLLDDVTWEND